MNQQEFASFIHHVAPRVVALMIAKMAKHISDSEGPRRPKITNAVRRLKEETSELLEAITRNASSDDIQSECADVVAMAMLIYDMAEVRRWIPSNPDLWYQGEKP